MQQPKVINATEHSGPPRLCVDCGEDISLLSPKALRCKRCAYEKEKAQARERGRIKYQTNRETVLQLVKQRQQTPEYKQKRKQWEAKNTERLQGYRQAQKQKHREKTGYNPVGRTCEKCHTNKLPENAGHNAKYCDDCKRPPIMLCTVCNKPLRGQGRRSGYCSKDSKGSEGCEEEYWRLKEEQGYSKVCTKCKVGKPHTAFRLRPTNRRNSACMRCEADATQEYIRDLPCEVRKEKKRIQHQREKEREANLSSEEQERLKDKRLASARRRKYGLDHDDIEAMLSDQDHECAICKTELPDRSFHTDHVEGTKIVRGILCLNCNFRLVGRYEKFPPDRKNWPYMNEYLARGKQQ